MLDFKKKVEILLGKMPHFLNFRDKIFPFSATLPIEQFYSPLVFCIICSYFNATLVLSNSNNSFNSTLYLLEKPHWKALDRFAMHAFKMIAVFSLYSQQLICTWPFTLVSVSPGLLNLFTALWTNCVINHLLLGTIPLSSVTKASFFQLPTPTTT